MNNQPHFDVVICTPGHSMVSAYVRSLIKTTNALDRHGITWNYMTEYSSHVADARERTIGGTGYNNPDQNRPGDGQFTYGKIFWIDSDIEWEPEDFARLLQSEKQVISGVYQMENEDVTVYPVPLGPPLNKKDIMKMKTPFTVRGVGFGFLAVKSGVFERLGKPWFSQSHIMLRDENTGQMVRKDPLVGEDLSWCERVHQMGVDIWVDPLVRVGHQKTVRLRWD